MSTTPTSKFLSFSLKSIEVERDQTTFNDYYFIKSEKLESEDLQIIGGGLEHCEPDFSVTRDSYIYYAIEYIVSGSCKFTIEDFEYELSSGSVFCYSPHQPHKIENTGNEPLVKYFINFTCSNDLEKFRSIFPKNSNVINLSTLNWVKEVFQQLQECGRADKSDAQSLCFHLLKYLLQRLKQTNVHHEEENTSSSYRTYQKIRSYIDSSYLNIHTIADVADACSVSVCHVSRLFRRFAKISPTNHLITLKLNHSLELLIKGDKLVKQIAWDVGFEDQFYFSNRFKKHFGVSPNNYRQILEKGTFTSAA